MESSQPRAGPLHDGRAEPTRRPAEASSDVMHLVRKLGRDLVAGRDGLHRARQLIGHDRDKVWVEAVGVLLRQEGLARDAARQFMPRQTVLLLLLKTSIFLAGQS